MIIYYAILVWCKSKINWCKNRILIVSSIEKCQRSAFSSSSSLLFNFQILLFNFWNRVFSSSIKFYDWFSSRDINDHHIETDLIATVVFWRSAYFFNNNWLIIIKTKTEKKPKKCNNHQPYPQTTPSPPKTKTATATFLTP